MEQDDGAVWESLCRNSCSFMNKTDATTLCKNWYNGTGRCNRRSCPLANSRYATITVHKGSFWLHIKRTEPPIGWDLVELRKDYHKALEAIDKYMEDCPEALVRRVKRLLAKMTRARELTSKMREMTITDLGEEKKKEVEVLEKSDEIELLKRLRREAMRMKCRARKKPPRRMFAIGGRKSDTKGITMANSSKVADYGDIDDNEEASTSDRSMKIKPNIFGIDSRNSKRTPRMLIEEPEIKYGESDNELQEIDIEDLVRDEPLKNAGYGKLKRKPKEGTSHLPMKRRPNVFGFDSGKSKRMPKAGTSDLPMKRQPNVFGLDSGKLKRKPKCVY